MLFNAADPQEDYMMSILKSEVPEFLRQTKLYRSFSDDADDETILIPRDCYKLDAVITSTEELQNMCKTIRFWLFDNFPPGMIYYVVEKFDADVQNTLREFENEFHVVEMLLDLEGKDATTSLWVAASCGRLDFVRYFESMGGLVTGEAVRSAGGNGHLDCLKYLHQRIRNAKELEPFLELMVSKMIVDGHMSCLKYCIEQGVIVSYEMLECAAKHDHVDRFQYLLLHSKLRDERVCMDAAKRGSLGCLKCAVDHQCSLGPGTLRAAVQGKSVPCAHYMLHSTVDFTANNQMTVGTMTAVRYNSADCLRLLLQAGWPVEDSTVLLAAKSGYAECFEPMIEYNVLCLTAQVMEAAVVAGQLHLIEYLHFHGCRWGKEAVVAYAWANRPNCLRYLLLHGDVVHDTVLAGVQLSDECAESLFDVRVEMEVKRRIELMLGSVDKNLAAEMRRQIKVASVR